MKVMICYPPVWRDGKIPLLGQNRQFRFSSSNEVRIYPIIPSIAATLLSNNGFEVLYLDAIVERQTYQEFLNSFKRFRPDLTVIETKTPIIESHWSIVDELKQMFPETLFALVGDHLTYNARESLEKSKVDFVITGGDYDFSILKLAQYLNGKIAKFPQGLWYRENSDIKNSGQFELLQDLDILPFIDRSLTKWWNYGEAYLYQPCTYIMWGRGCHPGKCTFCVWSSNFWKCQSRLRSVGNVLEEINRISAELNVKEIFDDTDTSLWDKKWVHKLCEGLIKDKFNNELKISCNARADNLDRETCQKLKKAGFRLLKVGLESGNNDTLKRLQKEETVNQIREGVKNAKDAELRVLLTVMVGYPWETEEHFKNTLKLTKELMLYKTKIGDSLQASLIIPYPGTPLYFEAIENNWFLINPCHYDAFDMSRPVLKTQFSTDQVMKFCTDLWRLHHNKKFKLKTLLSIRSFNDVKILWRGVRSVYAHKKDF